MEGPTKTGWRSVIRGNAPVRYEREDGAWVEVRPTRVDAHSVYEVVSSAGQTRCCEKYFEALGEANRLRDAFDKLGKRPPGRA
jgi:hypothetical protein